MFKNVFSFKGRIRRKEYIVSYIVFAILNQIFWNEFDLFPVITPITNIPKYLIFFAFGFDEMFNAFMLMIIATLIYLNLAQMIKRVHDSGHSAWYLLIPFYNLWLLFGAESDHGVNRYGPNPKGIGNPSQEGEKDSSAQSLSPATTEERCQSAQALLNSGEWSREEVAKIYGEDAIPPKDS